MGLKTKTNRVLNGEMGGQGCGVWLFPHGWCRLPTGFDVARFPFCCRRRRPPRRFCWPQQASSIQKFPPSATFLQDPRWAGHPYSGPFVAAHRAYAHTFMVASQACFASSRRLSRQPNRFAFVPARVALLRGVAVARALSQQRLGLSLALMQRRLYFAHALPRYTPRAPTPLILRWWLS